MTTPESSPNDDPQPEAPAEPEREEQQQNGSSEPSAEHTDNDFDEGALGQTATVINNFFAEVQAHKATFGMAGTGTRTARSTSRPLDEKEIAHALKHFAKPRGFDRAVVTLREQRVVVLVGNEGIGKWTSGVALLAQVKLPADKVVVLSPKRDLEELLATSFKKSRAYFIHDWIEGKADKSLRRFTFDTLSAKLAQAEAYLVITLNRAEVRSELGSFEVGWEPPDSLKLLDAHLGTAHPALSEAGIREHIAELRSPRQVVELAEQMLSGAQPAQEILDDLDGSIVTQWFGSEPKRSEVLVVAALAFAYGMPERVFERLVVRLTSIADEIERQGAERERRPIEEDLPQSRKLWNSRHPLIDISAEAGEPRVVFCSHRHREHVIVQLCLHYGYKVWEPLREWIRELATELPEVQVQVAAGLALLARTRPQEVKESFLEPWAGGLVQERLTAASTLSMMCIDDATAEIAFDTALGWVENAGQPQAMTAALAFAGGLSIRYPAEAVDWLWYLSLRGIRVSIVAQRALALLFQTAAERDGEAPTGLRLLAMHLQRDLHEGMEPLLTRRALEAVLGVLESDRLESEEPLMAWLLLSQPSSAGTIGVLWAWTLHNAHHRAEAIRALCRTLRALDGQEGAMVVADTLGQAVWATLPDAVAVLVKRAIDRACSENHARRDCPPAMEIVLALLNAGARRNNS
ncbi:hypothetical protein [Streptosporangium subroseum]|uniref:hypothetical protein n=1 Tax=Streptosporangium subroseum TaxID=106412 RepID=UPI003093856C|nr:hypothetical protein OHB15_49440 [Streptosporangium subroseum]